MPPVRTQKNFIRRTRDFLGDARGLPYSQTEFGERLGKSYAQIQRYERDGLPGKIDLELLASLTAAVVEAYKYLLKAGRKAEAAHLAQEAQINMIHVGSAVRTLPQEVA